MVLLLRSGPVDEILLNVNVPSLPADKISRHRSDPAGIARLSQPFG